MDFEGRKLASLQAVASSLPDKSRKGTIDAPIAPLIARINAHPAFFTTSSCSGRISISQEPQSPDHRSHSTALSKRTKEGKMKGGGWSFVSHSQIDAQDFVRTVSDCCSRSPANEEQQLELGLMVFRFEPFILAVECRSLAAAQAFVSCAISSGFRESGVTSMRKRIIAAVRCSIRVEAPIAEAGHLMVDEDYLKFLVRIANEKMAINHVRTEKFFSAFIDQLERPTTDARDSNIHLICKEIGDEELKSRCSQEQKTKANILEPRMRKLAELEKRQTRVLSRIHAVETLLPNSIPELWESSDSASPVILKAGLTTDGLCSETEVLIEAESRPRPGMDVKDRCADLDKMDAPLQEADGRAEQSCHGSEEGR